MAASFDSPSTAAAFSALQIGADLNLGGLHTLGRSSEEERARRLDGVIEILSVCLRTGFATYH